MGRDLDVVGVDANPELGRGGRRRSTSRIDRLRRLRCSCASGCTSRRASGSRGRDGSPARLESQGQEQDRQAVVPRRDQLLRRAAAVERRDRRGEVAVALRGGSLLGANRVAVRLGLLGQFRRLSLRGRGGDLLVQTGQRCSSARRPRCAERSLRRRFCWAARSSRSFCALAASAARIDCAVAQRVLSPCSLSGGLLWIDSRRRGVHGFERGGRRVGCGGNALLESVDRGWDRIERVEPLRDLCRRAFAAATCAPRLRSVALSRGRRRRRRARRAAAPGRAPERRSWSAYRRSRAASRAARAADGGDGVGVRAHPSPSSISLACTGSSPAAGRGSTPCAPSPCPTARGSRPGRRATNALRRHAGVDERRLARGRASTRGRPR